MRRFFQPDADLAIQNSDVRGIDRAVAALGERHLVDAFDRYVAHRYAGIDEEQPVAIVDIVLRRGSSEISQRQVLDGKLPSIDHDGGRWLSVGSVEDGAGFTDQAQILVLNDNVSTDRRLLVGNIAESIGSVGSRPDGNRVTVGCVVDGCLDPLVSGVLTDRIGRARRTDDPGRWSTGDLGRAQDRADQQAGDEFHRSIEIESDFQSDCARARAVRIGPRMVRINPPVLIGQIGSK